MTTTNPDTVYIFRSENTADTCNECRRMDGKIFFNKEDLPHLPLHPNCKCHLAPISRSEYEKKEKHLQRSFDKMHLFKNTFLRTGNTLFPEKMIRRFYFGDGSPYKLTYPEIQQSNKLMKLANNNTKTYLTECMRGERKDSKIDIKKELERLGEGEKITFTTHWDSGDESDPIYATIDTDDYLSFGSMQVGSDITITATRHDNKIKFEGKSKNKMEDIYDFNSNYLYLLNNEREAQEKGIGQPFKIVAEWKSTVSGEATKCNDGSLSRIALEEFSTSADNK